MASKATAKNFQVPKTVPKTVGPPKTAGLPLSKTTQVAMSESGETDEGYTHCYQDEGPEADYEMEDKDNEDKEDRSVDDFGDDEQEPLSQASSKDSPDTKAMIEGMKQLTYQQAVIKNAAIQAMDNETIEKRASSLNKI